MPRIAILSFIRLVVSKYTLTPRICKGDDTGHDEKHDPSEKERCQWPMVVEVRKNNRPGIKKNDFDVEQQEGHRDDVKANVETPAGRTDRIHARLVRQALYVARPVRAQNTGQNQIACPKYDRHEQQDDHGTVMAEVVRRDQGHHAGSIPLRRLNDNRYDIRPSEVTNP